MNTERKRVQGFTIDGNTSKDLDDAIWVQTFGNVGLIQVHIADPTELIELDSEIERSARSKLFTRYFSTGNHPMLPAEFSEDKCSLLPLVERPTLTVEARIDQTGEILNYELYESTLISLHQFSYEQVEDILYEKKATGFYLQLKQAEVWKNILAYKRQQLGAIGAMQRKGYFTDEEGKIIEEYSRSQSIIAEFAILANTLVAEWCKNHNLPVIYRNHQPVATDTADLRVHMNNLKISKEERSKYYHLLGRAQYSTINRGHFALALPEYLHFTSPLRRFADFVNHRTIKAYLRGESVPYDLKNLEYIANKINHIIENLKDKKNVIFKQKFQDKLKQISDYNSLNDKELFRVVKNKDYDEKLLEETFLARIQKKTLKEKSTVAGLFLTENIKIKEAIANIMGDDEIVYTMNLAETLIEGMQVEFIELENTQELKKTECILAVKDLEIKGIGMAGNKKTAKLNAAKQCLDRWIEAHLIDEENIEQTTKKVETALPP